VSDYVEVWTERGLRSSVPLDGDRLTIGRAAANDLTLEDPKASRFHAVLERLGPTWSVNDLSSRNGTSVNGARIITRYALSQGDEICIGDTRILYRSALVTPEQRTAADTEAPIPDLSRRERDVLEALCRPLLSHELVREPATTKDIADEFVVTEAAIRQHLLRLYDKFGIYEEHSRRRSHLAREALRRGVVQRR
jgi:pSer/pThr/pTyr-binding forkhead associated (FHA) protein